MDDAKEFVASLLKTVRDRLGNPFVSAFAIAWLIWNFRVILVLIGDGDGGWRAKIDYLDKTLMVPTYSWALHGVVAPLIFACIWIFALPRVLRWVALFHARQSHLTKEAMMAADESAPISAAERTELWSKMQKRKTAWDVERAELLKVIDELQKGERETAAVVGSQEVASSPASTPHSDTHLGDVLRTENAISDSVEIWKNAHLLGLKMAVYGPSEGIKRPRIDFNGHIVEWPWTVHAPGAASLGLNTHIAANLKDVALEQTDVRILAALRDDPRGRTSSIGYMDVPEQMKRSAIMRLRELGLVRPVANDLELAPDGRLLLAWMGRVGFEFEN